MLKSYVALILVGSLSLTAQSTGPTYPNPESSAPRYPEPTSPTSQYPKPAFRPYNSRPAAYSIPSAMLQCEGDQCTRGGGGAVWLFEGARGQAMWHYGAIASLTVQSFDGRTIVIHREDPNPSYSSPRFADPTKRSDGVFFADYVGTLHGDRIDGTVVWNGGGQGTWYATIPQSLCNPFSTCPLGADQLIQLGQNSLKAKLNYPALRSFWAAAAQGNSDGQAFAGIMIRDGVGIQANPAQGLALLKASADQDNYSGQLALSQSYELGLGVPQDPEQAAYWKQRAIRRVQELREQAARQEQQQQAEELLIGGLVLGAIAAFLISGSNSGDTRSTSSTDNSSDSYNATRRNEILGRQAWWYSHGGANGGPPPSWKIGDPTN